MQTPKTILFTIPIGQSESQAFDMGENGFRSPLTVLFLAPPDLVETANVMVCGPREVYCKLRTGMTVITLAAGCADQAMIMNVCKMKIVAPTAVGGDRIVEVVYNHTVYDRV